MTTLASLRLHPADEQRLRWFWCAAEGEMGIISNLGPLTERLASHVRRNRGSKPLGSAHARGVSDRQVDAVTDARDIATHLERMAPADVAVLRAHLGPLSPLHRQLEPTHDSYKDDPRRLAARHLIVFGSSLALVLHLLERNASTKTRTAADKHLTDEQRRVLAVERLLLVATKAQTAEGTERDSARAWVSTLLTAAESALVRASRAYQETKKR